MKVFNWGSNVVFSSASLTWASSDMNLHSNEMLITTNLQQWSCFGRSANYIVRVMPERNKHLQLPFYILAG